MVPWCGPASAAAPPVLPAQRLPVQPAPMPALAHWPCGPTARSVGRRARDHPVRRLALRTLGRARSGPSKGAAAGGGVGGGPLAWIVDGGCKPGQLAQPIAMLLRGVLIASGRGRRRPGTGSAETRARGSKGCEFATHVTASHAASRLSLCPAFGLAGSFSDVPPSGARVPAFGLQQGACFGCAVQAGGSIAPISQQTCAGLSKLRQPLAQDGKRIGPTRPVRSWRCPLQTAVLVPQAQLRARRRPVLGLPPAAGLRQEAWPMCSRPHHRA